ncbi:hypothetical protein WJX84_008156 [Apatococcus fuscideae]|uniref:non-specific serine/threonine protein kinase n=1 Tax=Apatococcus fuscideae TaxID=2026836 RepID=A0AAW1SWR4_9CHLO
MGRTHRRSRAAALCALLYLCGDGRGRRSGVRAEQGPQPRDSTEALSLPSFLRPFNEPLFASLLDGKVVAVDPVSGRDLWSFDSGLPLVSASNFQPDRSIFPGADGALYVYKADTRNKQGVEKLPVTVPELVESSPSLAADGSLVIGSRHTNVYLLDAKTGLLDHMFVDVTSVSSSLDGLPGDKRDQGAIEEEVKAKQPIMLGRKDYLIRSLDPATGVEHWNVTYSEIVHLDLEQPNAEDLDTSSDIASLDNLDGVLPGLSITGQKLAKHDVETGKLEWSTDLASPIVAVLPPAGEPRSDGPARLQSQSAAPALPSRPSRLTAGSQTSSSVLVGKVGSSLYALPAFDSLPQAATEACKASENDERQVEAQPMEVSKAEDAWSCPTGIVPINSTPSDVSFLPALPAKDMKALPDVRLAPVNMILDKGILALVAFIIVLFCGGLVAFWESITQGNKLQVQPHTSIAEVTTSSPAADTAMTPEMPQAVAVDQGANESEGTGHSSASNGQADYKKTSLLHPPPTVDNAAIGTSTNASEVKDASGQPDGPVCDVNELSKGRRQVCNGMTRVGRMEVTSEILGYGSCGTIVFSGTLDGRQVAVKRILRQFNELAHKEISALILSDEHPNIVRSFAMDEDEEFIYLALERCRESLADLMKNSLHKNNFFVTAEGRPTSMCLQLLEDMAQGLTSLHGRGIVHRDLKPQNVLITESGRGKLSDMGMSKRLIPNQSTFITSGAGGSLGWQSPEQLRHEDGGEQQRQGKSVDIFAMGLLIYYCMSRGQHAFGGPYEREGNILLGKPNLSAVSGNPEAENLLAAMLQPEAKQRPSMEAVMAHPFWWRHERRLAFLLQVSDRVELEDREVDQTVLQTLEACAPQAIGSSWEEKLSWDLRTNLGRYRKYRSSSLRDLLRVIRNKHNHFREMPIHLQEEMALPIGFLQYFTERFPLLLMTAYAFTLHTCAAEAAFRTFFPPAAQSFPFCADVLTAALESLQRALQQPAPYSMEPHSNLPEAQRSSSAEITVRSQSSSSTSPSKQQPLQEAGPMAPPRCPIHRLRQPSRESQSHRGWVRIADLKRQQQTVRR